MALPCGSTEESAMTDFSLADLERIVDARSQADPSASWTAKLVAAGQAKAAKKLGEEAVETVIAAIEGRKDRFDERNGRFALSSDGRIENRWRPVTRCHGGAGTAHKPVRPSGEGQPEKLMIQAARDKDQADIPDDFGNRDYSPYRFFSADEWAHFRADTPLTLTGDEVQRLRSLNDPIDLDEVRRIYLSLSRLLSAHVESSQMLFEQRKRFLSLSDEAKTPYVIGIAGSVAVGKSTTARILMELLARWPSSPKVDLVTTDGFLYPNAVLQREDMMEPQGFSGELRYRRAAALPLGDQGRQA
jgi:hypothetical protein